MRTSKAHLYFEWLFWIAVCIPLCVLASQKLGHLSSNIFPSHRGFFSIAGGVCMAVVVIVLFFYRPIGRLFPHRAVPYLSMGMIFLGLVCGVLFGEGLAYCAQESGALLDTTRFLCMMGAGIWSVLCVVLCAGSAVRLFRPGKAGRGAAMLWLVLSLLGLAMIYVADLHFGY